jgi:hypothetical protein
LLSAVRCFCRIRHPPPEFATHLSRDTIKSDSDGDDDEEETESALGWDVS